MIMDAEYDPPPGQPSPPAGEEATAPIGWIMTALLAVAVVAYVAHYLGWLAW
jgi:hypothetical protein